MRGQTAGESITPAASPSRKQHLIGGNHCEYDAVVYQKGSNGTWGITGRLDDQNGGCLPQGLAVELNYDTAILRLPDSSERDVRVAAQRHCARLGPGG